MVNQTRLQSFFESLNAAAFAAPTALLLHKGAIVLGGECAIATAGSCNDVFVGLTWFLFFTHSIFWKYVIRRVHDKYGIKLDPIHLVKRYILRKQ